MTYALGWAGRTHTIGRDGRTLRYEVEHAPWDIHPVRSYSLDLDWGAVYGPEWAFLDDTQPVSTVLAVGSPVCVWPTRN
jgi:uncharacterized protein